MGKIKFCHIIDASTANPLLFNSIKYSNREKFEYYVITFDPFGKLHEQLDTLGVISCSVHHGSRRQVFNTIWKIYRYLRREKIEIVQVHGFAASSIGLVAANLARVPVRVFSGHHSHEIPLYKRKLLTIFDSLTARFLANHIIAPSEDMKEIFVHFHKIPKKRIVVIHHGFDLEDWEKNAKTENNIKNDLHLDQKIIFGATGRLFWVKDFATLIKAFAIIIKKRKDVVLLVAGEGEEKKNLLKLISDLDLSSNVYLLGKRTDMASIMNCYDVFIHTAIAESFGLVFIEAFALGKPVISTRVGVAPEIIIDGENGFLVEKNNSEGLSAAILKILEMKKEYKTIAEKNISISKNFAVQKTQALVDKFCEKWLSAKK